MSARNRRLILSPRAERDVAALQAFSEQRWGSDQRLRYEAQIDQALGDLTRFPDLGRPRANFTPELRGLRVGEHVIYYKHDNEAITVFRILHRRMDPERHLPSHVLGSDNG